MSRSEGARAKASEEDRSVKDLTYLRKEHYREMKKLADSLPKVAYTLLAHTLTHATSFTPLLSHYTRSWLETNLSRRWLC